MANNSVKVDYDKFENKTITSMKDEYCVIEKNSYKLNAMLRHVSTPKDESLVLDLIFDGWMDDWFFLRGGNLIININDVDNIVLDPHESYTRTYRGFLDELHCVESDWYLFDKELLKRICDAESLEFKISGSKSYIIANANNFIKYAQLFYNGFFDEEAYKEMVTKSAVSSSEGCMVTLIIALSTLSSLALCLSLILGVF